MIDKRLLTVAALAGLTIGGLSVATAASAQGYGGDDGSATTSVEGATEVGGDTGTISLVQDGDEAETEGRQRGDRQGRRGRGGGCNLDEAAAAIGIDEADLRAAIDDGATIAEVAEANGVDTEVVIDAMVEAKAERLAEQVDEGRLTQDGADQKLADAESRIADRVSGEAGGADA